MWKQTTLAARVVHASRMTPVASACEVLIEIFTQDKDTFARLKPQIRRMAFQILGPELSQDLVAPTVEVQ